jgi:hypothetical protein
MSTASGIRHDGIITSASSRAGDWLIDRSLSLSQLQKKRLSYTGVPCIRLNLLTKMETRTIAALLVIISISFAAVLLSGKLSSPIGRGAGDLVRGVVSSQFQPRSMPTIGPSDSYVLYRGSAIQNVTGRI